MTTPEADVKGNPLTMEPLGRASRRSLRGEARRKVILQSATQLFSHVGFNSVSIADVAKDVGMTQAGLLHHFPSKAQLLLAVLLERDSRNDLESQAAREKGHDPLTVFIHSLRYNDRTPALVQLMSVLSAESTSENHPAHAMFKQQYEDIIISIAAEIAPIIDPSLLPTGVTIETLVRWLIALADGLRLQWLYDNSAVVRVQSLAQFFDMVLRPVLIEQYRSFSWVEWLRDEVGE